MQGFDSACARLARLRPTRPAVTAWIDAVISDLEDGDLQSAERLAGGLLGWLDGGQASPVIQPLRLGAMEIARGARLQALGRFRQALAIWLGTVEPCSGKVLN